jgi:hypothetical protein
LFYRGCHSQKAYPVLINFIQTGWKIWKIGA